MADISYIEVFPLANGPTPYRKISDDFVSAAPFAGSKILTIDPQALTLLTVSAFHDISHYLRPGHLRQLATIIADREASNNDRFVAIEFLKNANVDFSLTATMTSRRARPPA